MNDSFMSSGDMKESFMTFTFRRRQSSSDSSTIGITRRASRAFAW
jgi:hypothetical protein